MTNQLHVHTIKIRIIAKDVQEATIDDLINDESIEDLQDYLVGLAQARLNSIAQTHGLGYKSLLAFDES
jgi:hypothetical protein